MPNRSHLAILLIGVMLGLAGVMVGQSLPNMAQAQPAGVAPLSADLADRIDESCIVQFRRDALGTAEALALSPRLEAFDQARLAIPGTLRGIDPRWIVLETETEHDLLWIPREVVLLIEFEN